MLKILIYALFVNAILKYTFVKYVGGIPPLKVKSVDFVEDVSNINGLPSISKSLILILLYVGLNLTTGCISVTKCRKV